MFARVFSSPHSLKIRLALSLSIAGAVVALAILVLVSVRSEPAMDPSVARQGTETAYEYVWRLKREIVIVGLLTAAVFAGLGWLLAGRIAGPLMDIAEAARRIERGERDVAIPGKEGSDELALLARSMGSLVDSLTRRERDLERLSTTLEQRVIERTAELSHLNTRLEELSITDGLTGVANRRHFDTVLVREWRQAARYELPLSVVMIDIDLFKGYNDTYGHQQGDDCLRQVAATLGAGVTRAGDLVARYGGEEFAAILSHMTADEAVHVAEKLRSSVAALRMPHRTSPVAEYVTISLGVATMLPGRDDQTSRLLAQADGALYAAKEGGRNRVAQATERDAEDPLVLTPDPPRPPRAD